MRVAMQLLNNVKKKLRDVFQSRVDNGQESVIIM